MSRPTTPQRSGSRTPVADPVQGMEMGHARTASTQTNASSKKLPPSSGRLFYAVNTQRWRVFWDRLRGKNRPSISVLKSIEGIIISSWLNIFFLCVPFAWVSHFHAVWGHSVTFALCFLSIIPLENMFDWGGEQMTFYLGPELGDLLTITLNNAVEATLAIILLIHCELRLLQSTIVGVIILHLLLIPGTAFMAGGVQIWQQDLLEHTTQLNHSLLMLGVMAILLPTALFAALDRGAQTTTQLLPDGFSSSLINDSVRDKILRMSRGLSVLLLIVYVCSRVFVHSGPEAGQSGDVNNEKAGAQDNALDRTESHLGVDERHSEEEQPVVGPGACLILLIITVGIMAATAEWLVESIEFVREEGNIEVEWFGLILLPIVSFAADGTVAIVDFTLSIFKHLTGIEVKEPEPLARARAIDLSIQFALFWMPLLVLLGWWIGKPMHLMFDYFELALLLGACFLVNYVTADAKTNWVEGLILIMFYLMIAICAWFYVGQPELTIMLTCPGSVAEALASGVTENSG
ncbi:hypothetical protein CERSUDRAFT_115832 [Gelatoporia subvermispora B]|uniref:Sodium/calcium exchanger membrane region domain-containing protein n=1 Tax=Ceriporiopsis subvermispora (strain B) TaxID=914234 RepID=M2PIG9_CERS8|nr:hypothetical protein CERSUDRAFT_115832 [Gelatoporia subvermispora B]